MTALLQSAAGSPPAAWVPPAIALSLVIMALVALGVGVGLLIAALSASKRLAAMQDALGELRDDLDPAVKTLRRAAEDGGAVAKAIRGEADELLGTSRRLRGKIDHGAERLQAHLEDLESLYEVVYDEVEDSALTVAAGLRTARRGKALISPVSRFLRRRRRGRRRRRR